MVCMGMSGWFHTKAGAQNAVKLIRLRHFCQGSERTLCFTYTAWAKLHLQNCKKLSTASFKEPHKNPKP